MASNLQQQQQQHRANVHQNASAAQAEDTSTVDFEHQPKFTVEDDKRDLQSLTIDDMVRLQGDLTGMTSAGVPVEALGSPIQQDTAQLLASLDEELAKLPTKSTSSYYQAVKKCPLEVSTERRLAFLECDANNATLAAKRLAGYWELRLEFFTQNFQDGNNKAGPKDFSASSNAEACIPSAVKRVRSSSSGEKRQRQRRRRPSSAKKESMVDPRMAKAVKAKQADPEMKLYDALVLGGYFFYEKTGYKDLVNQDGTSLRQCKNNLCRRLRIERERKKAGQVSSYDQADSESTLSTGGEKKDQKGGEGDPGQGEEGEEEKEEERKPPAKPSGELSSKAVSTYQYDSFDEEIFQLPGWSDDDTNYKYR